MKKMVLWMALFFFGNLAAEGGGFSHSLFSSVLKEVVSDGHVNYPMLKADGRLANYLEQLKPIHPDSLKPAFAQLAFWINAYNAYTLKVICDNYPIKSINELNTGGLVLGTVLKTTVWDRKMVEVGGEVLTLNQIEHKIIRPRFREPRAHFALVCASKSCPPLRSEAYEGEKLEAQLTEQAKIFLNSNRWNEFDTKKRVAMLSKIVSWYGDDFAPSESGRLIYFAQFLPKLVAAEIQKEPKSWVVRYNDYDWRLNE